MNQKCAFIHELMNSQEKKSLQRQSFQVILRSECYTTASMHTENLF